MPIFDAYIFVDWSAASRPGPVTPTRDNIWIGEIPHPPIVDQRTTPEVYIRTRQEAEEYVRNRLQHHMLLNHRVLVGFDFPYGYPQGFAAALGLNNHEAWMSIWNYFDDQIHDNAQNHNSRFNIANMMNAGLAAQDQFGPFYGHPKGANFQHLNHIVQPAPNFPFITAANIRLNQLRICEVQAGGGVQPVWRLFGHGSVGSQALTGIPRLQHLRFHPSLADFSQVWPFETGFNLAVPPNPQSFILHAEIWPGIPYVRQRAGEKKANPGIIPDRAQVRAMCQWACHLDQNDHLPALFARPQNLNEEQIQHCVNEEGWILGVQ